MSTKNSLSILASFTACSPAVHTSSDMRQIQVQGKDIRGVVIGRSGTRQKLKYTTDIQATLLPNTLACRSLRKVSSLVI
ncbi:hypothetical protein BKAS_0285 [Bifidobacterium catenulatum subsp. kashiwanohense JCM 15439 = DSM 21854]|nr:hypothetical protein BKAS_0285 [Bifidobacterium catenulatum subsp. kashiwanohense JCM 15439 = DSM 21854]